MGHPEMKSDEKFLTNCTHSDFEKILIKTKRMGERAYDMNGKLILNTNLRPVFVKKDDEDNDLLLFNKWYKFCKATGGAEKSFYDFQEESKTEDLEIVVESDLLKVFYKGKMQYRKHLNRIEPKDVSFTRGLSWVPDLIKTVYELGKNNE